MAVRKKPTQAEKAKKAKQQAEERTRGARAISNARAAEAQVRVRQAAAARGIANSAGERVDVAIPSLDGIDIQVPPPAPITQADVDDRIVQLQHRSAESQGIGMGSRVERGDQVKLDLLGYHDGDLILTVAGTWYVVEDNVEIPDLFGKIEGMMVGEEKILEVTLSEQYPDEDVSGDPAVMIVKIHEARRPALPRIEDLFEMLGVEDEAGVREGVKQELAKERSEALVSAAVDLLIDELLARSPNAVPDRVVEDALNALWRQEQGNALAQRSVELDEQNESRQAFIQDETLREEIRRRVFERALLDKVIAEREIPEERSMLLENLVGLVTDSPVSANTVHEMLTGKGPWNDAFASQLRDLRALEWLVAQVKVGFQKADGTVTYA